MRKTYLKAFRALSSQGNRQFHHTKEKAVTERSCLSYIHSPTRGIDIRYGVGVDCLFRVRRLAMPLGDKQEHHSTLFVYKTLKVKSGMEATQYKIMDKFLKSLMLLLVTVFSLTLTACGGDDEPDDPTKPPTTQTDVTKGAIGINHAFDMAFQSHSGCYMWLKDSNTITVYGFQLEKVQIVYVGKVKGLEDIKTAPKMGWSDSTQVNDGGGYIINYVYGGTPYYVRVMLRTNTDATGEVVGVNYAYQYFTPSNL